MRFKRRPAQRAALEVPPNAEEAAVLAQATQAQRLYARVLFLKRSRISVEGALQVVDERLAAASTASSAGTGSDSAGRSSAVGSGGAGRNSGSSWATAATSTTGAEATDTDSSTAAAGSGSRAHQQGAAGSSSLNPWRILRVKLQVEQAAQAALAGGDSARTRKAALCRLSAALTEAAAAVRRHPSWALLRLMTELFQLLAGCSGPAVNACLAAWQAFLDGPDSMSTEQLLALPHPYVELGGQDSRVRWGCDPPNPAVQAAPDPGPYRLECWDQVNQAMHRGRQAFCLAAQEADRHTWLAPAALQRILQLAAQDVHRQLWPSRLQAVSSTGSTTGGSGEAPLGHQQQQSDPLQGAAGALYVDNGRDRGLLRRLGQQSWLRHELRRRLAARFPPEAADERAAPAQVM